MTGMMVYTPPFPLFGPLISLRIGTAVHGFWSRLLTRAKTRQKIYLANLLFGPRPPLLLCSTDASLNPVGMSMNCKVLRSKRT